MNKSLITLGAIGFIILLIGFNGCSTYNNMVQMDEGVNGQWKQVEVVYQARMDKTKNLLEIVQQAANFEKGTLTDVMEARSRATTIKLTADDLTEENLAKFKKAQDAFGQSLGRLMAVAENYPQLQSIQAFRDFQAQYEGMENRIAEERRKFNDVVQALNQSVRTFPRNIWAGIFGIHKRAYFSAEEGAEKAPDIKKMSDTK